ncbi:hypothetical protein StoSoilB13_03360 [Arthrobacter sp. StoSoilB13]|nr:hypothetical protein StoSoilB13_03360 [Arthrobacter sp. StoSoilB13]
MGKVVVLAVQPFKAVRMGAFTVANLVGRPLSALRGQDFTKYRPPVGSSAWVKDLVFVGVVLTDIGPSWRIVLGSC